MSENNKSGDENYRIDKLEKKIDSLVDDLKYEAPFRPRYYPFHHPKNVLEQLYISPRKLLISVTLLNVILFIGGTVYTGLQVTSIQEKYEEASIKISDAKQKYLQAEQSLKSIEIIEKATKNRLSEIERTAENLISTLGEKSRDGFNKVREIKGESEKELELLRKSSAAITASMNRYKENTESELKEIAEQIALKLERDIEFNSEEIKRKQDTINDLGLNIQGLATTVEIKTQEISRIQGDIKSQLELANALNTNFTDEIKNIAKTDKITFSLLWNITDVWVKIVFSLAIFLLLALSMSAIFNRKNA